MRMEDVCQAEAIDDLASTILILLFVSAQSRAHLPIKSYLLTHKTAQILASDTM